MAIGIQEIIQHMGKKRQGAFLCPTQNVNWKYRVLLWKKKWVLRPNMLLKAIWNSSVFELTSKTLKIGKR